MQNASVQGLGANPRPQLNAMQKFKLAVMPKRETKSLSQVLDDLSDTERQRLESYAKMLLMTASPSSGDYKAQIQRMYPRLDSGLQLLLAQLLQEIEPREIAPDPLIKRHNDKMRYFDELEAVIGMNKPKPVADSISAAFNQTASDSNSSDNSIDFSERGSVQIDIPASTEKPKSRYDQFSTLIADADGNYANKAAFMDQLEPVAAEVSDQLGIDPRIVMAQAILETGYGSKVKGKNYFGIKGKGQAFTTHEEVDGLMIKQKDQFRTYDSLEDSVRDYALFLQENKRYRPLLEAKTLDQQIDALARSGYATDSKYGDKIRGIIRGKTFKELLG